MIPLRIKKLQRKTDERGWLSELVRPSDVDGKGFGQFLLTTANPGKSKGNHYHLRKREWYCVIKGRGLLRIVDRNNGEKKELEVGDKELMLIEVPRGFFHTITNIGDDMMYLLVYINEPFDPTDPDTYYVKNQQK